MRFEWHSDSGIFGWVAANRYPKQKEFVYFSAAVWGIPAVMLGGWSLFLLLSAGLARLCKRPRLPFWCALAALHFCLLAPWPRLLAMDPAAWKAVLPPLLYVGLPLLGAFGAWNWWLGRRPHPGPAADSHPVTAPPLEASVQTAQRQRHGDGRARFRKAATGLLVYGAVPVLIYGLAFDGRLDGRAVDFFHDSEQLVPLRELQQGALPYRDIYIQHGLLHNAWIPWLGAQLFGPTVEGCRRIEDGLAPLNLIAVYVLVLATFRWGWLSALIAAVVFLAAGTGGRSPFGYLSVAVLASAIKGPYGFELLAPREANTEGLLTTCLRQGWRLILAGVLALLAWWHSVEVGLYALATGVLFTAAAGLFQNRTVRLRARLLPLACVAAGAFLGFWLFGWYFLLHGAFVDLLRNAWVQCVYQTEVWGLAMPNFLDVLRPLLLGQKRPAFTAWIVDYWMVFYIGAVAIVGSTVALACRACSPGFWSSRWAPRLLLLTLLAFCSYRTVLGRTDMWHTGYSLFFAALLGLFAVAALAGAAGDRLLERTRRPAARLGGGLLLLIGAGGVGFAVHWYLQTRWHPGDNLVMQWTRLRTPTPPAPATASPVPGVGALGLSMPAEKVQAVVAYIQTNTVPGERVFDFSNQALWLVLADRRPASRYFLTTYAATPAMQREVIADLERQSVNLVIYSGGSWFDRIDRIPTRARQPLLAAYLDQTFKPAATIGSVTFWRRAPPAAAP